MKKRRKKWNRKKKYVVSLIATLIILSSIYLMTVLLGDAVNKNALDLSGPYDVIRVVDGDTIIADIDGTETRIRLIGIDTPESVSAPPFNGLKDTLSFSILNYCIILRGVAV